MERKAKRRKSILIDESFEEQRIKKREKGN